MTEKKQHPTDTTPNVAAQRSAAPPVDRAVPDDLLDLYFSELGKVRLLTAADEVRLAQAIESGKEARAELEAAEAAGRKLPAEARRQLERRVREGGEAFEHFVAANLRLVVSIAAKFSKSSSLELGELVQEGNVGLITAVEKFDWRKGYKFSTYATWWIRQAIQRGVAAQERTIRLPVAVHDALTKVRAARNRLESETGREPTTAELAAATNLTEDKVRHALDSVRPTTSLDRRVGDDDDAAELGDFVAVASDSPADEVVDRDLREGLFATAREHLDERSWYVLQRRYGLDDGDIATLDVVGRELGVSRETVRKIEHQALARLRDELAAA